MPIRFDLSLNADNELRVSIYLSYMCFMGCVYMIFMFKLGDAQKSVAMFKMPNITSFPSKFYRIPYDDCRCSVIRTEKCLTDIQLKAIRIIILSIFVSQVCLLWEYLWLSGNRIYIFAYAYWITSIFIFLGISVLIHRSNYYHDVTSSVLLLTGMLLFGSTTISIALKVHNVQFGNQIL